MCLWVRTTGDDFGGGDRHVDFLIFRADRLSHGIVVWRAPLFMAGHARPAEGIQADVRGSDMTYDVHCVHCQETLLTTAQIGDAVARIIAAHLETRHPAVLDAAVGFDDPGLAEILHHVRVTNR